MKKKLTLIGVILLTICLVTTLIGTFATDVTVATNDNTHTITLTGSTGEITVPAGTSKTVIYQITNTNKGVVKYGVAYSGDNIVVKVYNDTIDSETGTIDYGENKFIKLYIKNTGDTESTASIKTILGYEFGGELEDIVPTGYTLVTEEYTLPKGPTLISHITNLYLDNKDDTLVETSKISYRYASSVSLMNDRQGTMDVGEDNGNIRYYGSNPNNYIYFNCSDYSNQTSDTCELWRIIGIVDGKVKIIKDESLGTMAWNSDGYNNWDSASLKTYLNGDYYTTLQTTNNETLDLISTSTWYLGGYSSLEVAANNIYIYERTEEVGTTIYEDNPFTIEANIGLMYASDYGYAMDLSLCSNDLEFYSDPGCYGNDWLAASQWLLTPSSSGSSIAWRVYGNYGYVNYASVDNPLGVRPVLYLDSDLTFESESTGTSTDPYRISVS